MHGLAAAFLMNKTFSWQRVHGPWEYRNVDGVFVNFPFVSRVSRRRALEALEARLRHNNVEWLTRAGESWRMDLDGLRNFVGDDWQDAAEWMTGKILINPDVENGWREVFEEQRETTWIHFIITREEIALSGNKRIFLSHKGVDKPLVRRIDGVLRLLGFEPWLDEFDMVAGAELDRALLAGMKDSCAAVFFVTSNYTDEKFLATEINYAIAEKRGKGVRFSIITLVVPVNESNDIVIPDLLKTYVWKQAHSELEMLEEIIKALPIRVGEVRWRM